MLDIPNMFVSWASITATNVHHLALKTLDTSQNKTVTHESGSHYGSL